MEKKSRITKISKTAVSSPVFLELNDQPNVVVDVREPFYIDRYKKVKHLNCHQDGQCMACLYAKLNYQQSSSKWSFLHSKRNSFQKGSQLRHNAQSVDKMDYLGIEKFRIPQGTKVTKAFLISVLKDKISLIEKGVKTNFKNETGHEIDDNKVAEICLKYFERNKNTDKVQEGKNKILRIGNLTRIQKLKDKKIFHLKFEKNEVKLKKDQNKKIGLIMKNKEVVQQSVKQRQQKAQEVEQEEMDILTQVLKEIYKTNMTKLFTKESFINMYKNPSIFEEGYEYSQRSIKSNLKTKRNFTTLASINIQIKNEEENKRDQTEKSHKKLKNKKVTILLSEQSSCLSKSESIYTQLLIDIDENGEQNLGESVRTQLNQLSLSTYQTFKGVIGGIESKVISHFKQREDGKQKMLKKMETATNWIKRCVLQNDVHRQEKYRRIDKMLNNFRNIKGSKLKRNQSNKSRAKGSKGGFFGQSQMSFTDSEDQSQGNMDIQNDSDKFDAARKKKSNMKNKHSKKGENNYDDQEQSSSQNDNVIEKESDSENQSISVDNTEKLIQGEVGDEFQEDSLNQGFGRRFSNTVKRNERKSSVLSKNIISKHTKSDELHWSQIQKDIQNFGPQNQNEQINNLFGFDKQKLENRRNSTNGAFGLQRTSEQEAISERQKEREKQRKKKYILRIKAAELLHKNEQTISLGLKALEDANLQQYAIHAFDSVLTQKKKIRYVKQVVRRRSENGSLDLTLFQQIMEYLSIYEQSCNILIEASGPVVQTSKQEEIENMRNLIGRKDIFNELLFYNLDSNYIYGGAEDEDINFTANTNLQQRSETGKKRLKKVDLSRIVETLPKQKIKDPVFKPTLLFSQQLVQVELQVSGLTQDYDHQSFNWGKSKLDFFKKKCSEKDDPQNFSKIQQFLQEKRMERRKYRRTCDQSTMISSIKKIRI